MMRRIARAIMKRTVQDDAVARTGPSFKERMDTRLARWYKGVDPHPDTATQKRRKYISSLVNKTAMFKYAQRHDIPLPIRYAETSDISSLDFSALPERIVVKPNNSADSDCVMLFSAEREIFSGKAAPQEKRADFVSDVFSKGRFVNEKTKILVEEFIQDYDSRFEIPRDFKVYVAGGRSHLIQVIDRNGPKPRWSHRFYTRDWTPINDHFQRSYALCAPVPKPPRLNELLVLSDRIATDLGCFLRLDFFMASDRVVFGEFTTYPFAGKNYTKFGETFLCRIMDEFPDSI